jgi:hypothetical protein
MIFDQLKSAKGIKKAGVKEVEKAGASSSEREVTVLSPFVSKQEQGAELFRDISTRDWRARFMNEVEVLSQNSKRLSTSRVRVKSPAA